MTTKPHPEDMPLVQATAPESIWLDLGFDPRSEGDAHFSNLHRPTWSADNATGNGIKYIRTDLAEQRTRAMREAVVWSPAGYNKELAVDATGKVRGEVCEHAIDPRWDARANDSRLGEYLTRDQAKAAVLAALAATPHHPASAEAGKGVEEELALLNEWAETSGRTSSLTTVLRIDLLQLIRAARARPSESVAVSGEVSEDTKRALVRTLQGAINMGWLSDTEAAEISAVLALAGSGGKS